MPEFYHAKNYVCIYYRSLFITNLSSFLKNIDRNAHLKTVVNPKDLSPVQLGSWRRGEMNI